MERAELGPNEEQSLCSILSFVAKITTSLMQSLGQNYLPQTTGRLSSRLEDGRIVLAPELFRSKDTESAQMVCQAAAPVCPDFSEVITSAVPLSRLGPCSDKQASQSDCITAQRKRLPAEEMSAVEEENDKSLSWSESRDRLHKKLQMLEKQIEGTVLHSQLVAPYHRYMGDSLVTPKVAALAQLLREYEVRRS